MKDELLIRYAIGGATVLVGLLLVLICSLVARHHKATKMSATFHVIESVLLCAIVIIVSEYAELALIDFHIQFISIKTINVVQSLFIGLIVIQRLFQLIDLFEYLQVKKHGDPTSARIIARVFKIIAFVVLVLLFGERFGMSLSGLMTFGGLGGIAVGIAGKETLSNFFSGVMLYFDRPFNIGDWISSPDRQIEGTVMEVGWRLTKIMTFDHRPLYVPNSAFSSISVENPGRMTNRRINTELTLRYEDADKIGVIVNDIRTMLEENIKIDTSQTLLVYFNAFGDSSLNIMVYCFTKTTKWAEWLSIQQDVYLSIIEIVHKHGADFAFPSRTIYMDNDSNPQTPAAVLPQEPKQS